MEGGYPLKVLKKTLQKSFTVVVTVGRGYPVDYVVVMVGVPPLPSWLLLQAAGVPSPSMTPTVVDPGAPSNSIPCTGLVEERVRE